jgi:hypothetical protein
MVAGYLLSKLVQFVEVHKLDLPLDPIIQIKVNKIVFVVPILLVVYESVLLAAAPTDEHVWLLEPHLEVAVDDVLGLGADTDPVSDPVICAVLHIVQLR